MGEAFAILLLLLVGAGLRSVGRLDHATVPPAEISQKRRHNVDWGAVGEQADYAIMEVGSERPEVRNVELVEGAGEDA